MNVRSLIQGTLSWLKDDLRAIRLYSCMSVRDSEKEFETGNTQMNRTGGGGGACESYLERILKHS